MTEDTCIQAFGSMVGIKDIRSLNVFNTAFVTGTEVGLNDSVCDYGNLSLSIR